MNQYISQGTTWGFLTQDWDPNTPYHGTMMLLGDVPIGGIPVSTGTSTAVRTDGCVLL